MRLCHSLVGRGERDLFGLNVEHVHPFRIDQEHLAVADLAMYEGTICPSEELLAARRLVMGRLAL